MKKGFLASKPEKATRKAKAQKEVPYVAPAPKANPLQMQEVQEAMKGTTDWLKEDNSWVTPQLAAALQMNPTLLQGLQNPKITEALGLMQSDPKKMQAKYGNDP